MSRPGDPPGRSEAAQGRPSLRRTILAFALAPGVAAAALLGFALARTPSGAAWRTAADLAPAVLLCAYVPALALGAPAFLAVPARLRGRLAVAVPLGAASAAAPWILAAALPPHEDGLLGVAWSALAFGAVGGLTFWAIRRRWPR